MKLTPDDLEKLHAKEIANAIRKLHAGKTFTSAERALLAQASVGGSSDAAGGFVATWDDLAQRLGTTRRSLQEWRKDPRYAPDCPVDRADGRHDVAAFAAWMLRHNLKRAAEHEEDSSPGDHSADEPDVIHPPRLGGSQADWTKALIREKHEAARLDRLTTEGSLLVATELEVPLGSTFAALQAKLSQFPSRVARHLVGLRDVAEIEDKLRDEIDADLADLHAGRFTAETAVADAVRALPFDAETDRLFKLVTFDGQDETALLALITAVATQAVRSLGKNAIAQTRDEQPPAAGDEITDDAQPSSNAPSAIASAAASAPPAQSETATQTASAPGRAESATASDAKPAAPSPKPRAGNSGKKKRRSRKPEPRKLPPDVEGAIYAEPRKKRRK